MPPSPNNRLFVKLEVLRLLTRLIDGFITFRARRIFQFNATSVTGRILKLTTTGITGRILQLMAIGVNGKIFQLTAIDTTRNSPIRGYTISVDKKSTLIVDYQGRYLTLFDCPTKCTISVNAVVDANVSLPITWWEILPRAGWEIVGTFRY